MNPPLYFDTSALAKLLLHEYEGPAVKEYLNAESVTMVSSELAEVELVRTVRQGEARMDSRRPGATARGDPAPHDIFGPKVSGRNVPREREELRRNSSCHCP